MKRTPYYSRAGITLYCGDSLEVAPELDAESVSAVVTDPPYGLGFMGKAWDKSVPGVPFWTAFMHAMKPGAHLLSFGGSRTFHRIAVAIEDAGFELRDTLMWLYGSGFPKSHDVSKAIDKRGGRPDLAAQIGAAIKQARESRGMSASECDRRFCDGTTNWSWFEGRPTGQRAPTPETFARIVAEWPELAPYAEMVAEAERAVVGQSAHKSGIGNAVKGHYTVGGTKAEHVDITAPATPAAEQWQGWGTALKPAYEPVILARKPLAGTVAANVLQHGTGALNIDASRIGTDTSRGDRYNGKAPGGTTAAFQMNDRKDDTWHVPAGRWPANVILDEAAAEALDRQSGELGKSSGGNSRVMNKPTDVYGWKGAATSDGINPGYGDTGGASRFFKTVTQDHECITCGRTYEPKHGIMNATKEVASCDHASSAATSSAQSEAVNDSAPGRVRGRQPLASEGNNQSNNGPASNAASSSGSTQPTRTPIAAVDAWESLSEELVPRVRSAANLCDSCVTAIARSLARMLHGQTPASHHGLDCMPNSNASILIRNLASYAEPMANTGIIPTTASLSILFGSVAHAIDANTSKALGAPSTAYAPTRFLYQSKASRRERNAGLDGMPERDTTSVYENGNGLSGRSLVNGEWVNTDNPRKPKANHHPTVKPLALMRYLITLVTPPGGIVLDPFAGSGSTLVACAELGFPAIGIELSEEYCEIIARRVDHALNERPAVVQPSLLEMVAD